MGVLYMPPSYLALFMDCAPSTRDIEGGDKFSCVTSPLRIIGCSSSSRAIGYPAIR